MKEKVLCLVWAPFSPRMDELAAELDAKRVNMTILYGHRQLAPLRYLILFAATAFLLLKERPSVVYTQNPPIFCPLSCLPFCKIWRRKLMIDHHAVWSTKTLGKRFLGRSIRRIEKFVSSRAFANTSPHPMWSRELEELGAKQVVTIYDYVPKSAVSRSQGIHDKYSEGKNFLVLAPHGGHPLERLESEIEAARSIDAVMLLLSGPETKLRKRLDGISFPVNAKYIGFIEKNEYKILEASIDIGLSVTDEPYTLSHALLEFASCSIPIVSSKQPPVSALFGDSILYVDSSDPRDVVTSIQTAIESPGLLRSYAEKIAKKHNEMTLQRQEAVKNLLSLIEG